MIKKAYKNFNFENITNISKFENVEILELFYGPTDSFKDYALSLLAQFYDYFLNKKNQKVTILVGTSGVYFFYFLINRIQFILFFIHKVNRNYLFKKVNRNFIIKGK
jgi:hypothetical protein